MWVSGFDKASERVISKEAGRVNAVQVLEFAVKLISFTVNEKT